MAEAYSFTRDGAELAPSFRVIQAGELSGSVSPNDVDGSLEVFRMPLKDLPDFEDDIHAKERQMVPLGPIPTHVASGSEIAIQAEPGYMYDLFFVGCDDDGVRRLMGGGRYAVTGDPEYRVSRMITLDEARFFGAAALGLDEEQAARTEARIVPMTAWGNAGRLAIVGFELNNTTRDSLSQPGVMVDHVGGVDFFHGMDAEQTRQAAGL